jgi:3-deoxy-D-manno-octulosonic acid kinase
MTPDALPPAIASETSGPQGAALVRRLVKGSTLSGAPSVVDALAAVLNEHDTLYDWAGDQPQPRALRGRAPVFVAALPTTNAMVVVRHAWHGGLLAPITRDRFRGTGRAQTEFVISARLRTMGIPTTEVLGFAAYPTTFGFRTVDVVSRFVPEAFDLGTIAAGLVPEMHRDEALAATQQLLARLAKAGVRHPDLNVKNVLLTRASDGSLTAMIIDVDVVQWEPQRAAQESMQANVARLLRSMRKWRRQFGCDLPDDLLERFAGDAFRSVDTAVRA